MKKLVLMVAVMMIAAPAMADIIFAVTDHADGTFTVSYTTTNGDLPRGVAIKVYVDDQNITGSNSQMSAFNANIDYLYDNPGQGVGDGHGLAKDGGPGVFPGGENVAVISTGVLDQGGFQGAGPSSGNLITITTAMEEDSTATVTLSADGLRGPGSGVVGSVIPSNLPVVQVITFPPPPGLLTVETAIFPDNYYIAGDRGTSYYDAWLDAGSPACWAYPNQCHGDADGRLQGSTLFGQFYVSTDDINVMFAGWEVKEPPKADPLSDFPNGILGEVYEPTTNPDVELICGDFDHKLQGSTLFGQYYISSDDINILMSRWEKKEPPKAVEPWPNGIGSNCGGTHTPPE